eukprot:Phypoly_transcript_11231.p1 GENE.Phypoly_transcript_11231~~Phypoly_transcript_11231.p1  ORF type:complete len:271 (+),score=13.04 Phypoly_transcript_11231:231-1043(+)
MINDEEASMHLRAAAMIALLAEDKYFEQIGYHDKIKMFNYFIGARITVSYGKTVGGNFLDYITKKYLQVFPNERDLVTFVRANIQLPGFMSRDFLESLCEQLIDSEDAHSFFRYLTFHGNQLAAKRLAAFNRDEDVCLLTYYFLPKKRIGRDLPKFPNVEYEASVPFHLLDGVLQFFPATTKIHLRTVCKKWFNELNEESRWELSCRAERFTHISSFTWQQSYFLQKDGIDPNEKMNYDYLFVRDLAKIFPHPLFRSLLGFYPINFLSSR